MRKDRIIKSYGARGMLDWQMALNVAGAILRIGFTNGSMGPNGIIPARYTTDNEVIQRLIEKSHLFNKRIVLLETKVVKAGEEECGSRESGKKDNENKY